MWAAHQVHHSSEDYNLTTALRQSVLQRYFSWVCMAHTAKQGPYGALKVSKSLEFDWTQFKALKSLNFTKYLGSL